MKTFRYAKLILAVITLSWVCALSGCASVNNEPDLIATGYEMADNLIAQITPPLAPDRPLLVATFVNIDKLNESSTFGRTVSEFVASRFTLRGYKVIEMKLRNSVYIRENSGEFILSRDVKNISAEHNAQAVIAGTYSVANNVVYVKANIIDPMNSFVKATCNYKFPIGADTYKMLGIESRPGGL